MLNVTIVNCYQDSNKGSCAIAWGLIRRLEATGFVKSISVVSIFGEEFPLFGSVFRHLEKAFPHVTFLASPIKSLVEMSAANGRPAAIKRWHWRMHVLRRLLELRTPSGLNRRIDQDAALQAISQSDLVIDRGGPFFAAGRSLLNPSLYFFAWPLLFAKRIGVPYAFAPESVGPLSSVSARVFVRNLFEGSQFITVREDHSKSALTACGIAPDRIKTMLDSAFWVEPDFSPRVAASLERYHLEPNRFLAVCCRQWIDSMMQPYHSELARTIDGLVPDVFPRAALVLNTYCEKGRFDDRAATRHLFGLVKKKSYVSIIEEDFCPAELVALYGQARLLLGTRLHSVILALAGGTPAVAVSYAGPKTIGIMRLLGLGSDVLEMEAFKADEACQAVRSAIDRQHDTMKGINALRSESDRLFRSLLEEILQSG